VAVASVQSPPESPEALIVDPRLARAHDLVISDDDAPHEAPVASASGEPALMHPHKKPRWLDLERGVSHGQCLPAQSRCGYSQCGCCSGSTRSIKTSNKGTIAVDSPMKRHDVDKALVAVLTRLARQDADAADAQAAAEAGKADHPQPDASMNW
jgi:hypothetical protein